ncbi:MAG TPA: glycosyl hydrolase family 28 protein [Polyangiaceae bacterium]|jgi:hypothetical protein
MTRRLIFLLTAAAFGCSGTPGESEQAGSSAATVVTSHANNPPSYMPRSSDYAVQIRDPDDGAWKPVDVISDVNGYQYAQFATDGPLTVQVVAKNLTLLQGVSITPKIENYPRTISGNAVTVSLPSARYAIVTIAGISPPLVLIGDPVVSAPPDHAAGTYNIADDARTRNDLNNIFNTTAAIQSAVDNASAYGSANGTRGIVFVPPGAYALGNLTLKSNVELYMSAGAAFFFAGNVTTDKWNYTYSTDWTSKGDGTRWIKSQPGATNIKIWGNGTFDGNSRYGTFGNNVFVLDDSSNVDVEGIVIRRGSKWGTMVGRSNHVTFANVKFFQDLFGAGEDDGIDVIESQNVTVKDSIAIAFDDTFSVKTYSGAPADNFIDFGPTADAHQPAKDILFDGDIAWTGCHAFKVGQGAAQPESGITFQNGVVYDAAHAVSIHHKTGTATIQNLTWQNIEVERTQQTNLGRSWAYINIEDAGAGVGSVQDVLIQGIHVRDLGADESPINGLNATATVQGLSFVKIRVDALGRTGATLADLHVAPNAFTSSVTVTP